MINGHRIDPSGNSFTVIDPWQEHVNTYPPEEAAKQDIKRCMKEDAMYETAKLLVDTAIKTHMQMFDVDREKARYWIRSASEVID
jgi:hypothetical protein